MDNHGIASRIGRSLAAARKAWDGRRIDMDIVNKQIDAMIQSKELATVEKQSDHSDTPSQLDVRDMKITMYNSAIGWMRSMASGLIQDAEPPYGNVPTPRDLWLDKLWRKEPILAGAVYSMTAKMTALKWQVTGKRLQARAAAQIFAEAAHIDGWDWGGFISATAQDFYCRNNGAFWETARKSVGSSRLSRLAGGLAELGHIDSLCCELTGNKQYPVHYVSYLTGQQLYLQPGEFIHFTSMPSPREENLGIGYCAVDRAIRSARLLMGLHDYDDEKLRNLPPEGVATVTGLTMDEFQDAIGIWKAKREQDKSLTFPQVLWLIGNQAGQDVSLDFKAFSEIPESFDRRSVVDQYVATLALCFGVDVREFWPISGSSMGTASESEIQHLKAKGKGPGEFLSITERFLNAELDQETMFAFDTQDIEEDANAAAIAKAWIDAFFTIYNLPPQGAQQEAMRQQAQQQEFSNKLEQSKLETQARAQEEFAKAKAAGKTVEKANPRPDKPNGQPMLPTPMVSGVDTGRDMTNGGGQPNTPQQAEQVIDKNQFLRLLVDKGVLPDYFINDQRTMVRDVDVRLKDMEGDPNDVVCYTYEKGVLKEQRLPPYEIVSPKEPAYDGNALQATMDWLRTKEAELVAPQRRIRGKPISAGEVARGGGVTRNTIHEELERWRKDPILAQYALTEQEEADLLKRAQLS